MVMELLKVIQEIRERTETETETALGLGTGIGAEMEIDPDMLNMQGREDIMDGDGERYDIVQVR